MQLNAVSHSIPILGGLKLGFSLDGLPTLRIAIEHPEPSRQPDI
ncbi:MAG: hypothetical protein ACFB0G_05335 [Leptolyngbyaceae cyanobacterium]